MQLSFTFDNQTYDAVLEYTELYSNGQDTSNTYRLINQDSSFTICKLHQDGSLKIVHKSLDHHFIQIESDTVTYHAERVLIESLDNPPGTTCQQYTNPGFVKNQSSISSTSDEYQLIPGTPSLVPESIGDDSARRLLTDSYAFYPNCYSGDTAEHDFTMGIVADLEFYKMAGGTMVKAQDEIDFQMATVAAIYKAVFNINLKLAIVRIASPNGYDAAVHDVFKGEKSSRSCPTTLGVSLGYLRDYANRVKDNEEITVGSWHVVSGCTSGDAMLGTAHTGTICQGYWNCGASVYYSRLWRTVAHELGHGFGASHSFENGIGRTGGIMDYADGSIIGSPNLFRFQFSRRTEMCTVLQRSIDENCQHLTLTSQARCGDKSLTSNEECECANGSTSCTGCSKCKLTASVCSSGTYMFKNAQGLIVYADPKCCASNKYTSSSTACTSGYCENGACVNKCLAMQQSLCGSVNGGCRAKCSDGNTCSANVVYNGNYIGNMVQGTQCSDGTCDNAGNCIASVTKYPTIAPTNKPTSKPTIAPTKPSFSSTACVLTPNTDYFGGDIILKYHVESVDSCASLCQARSGCTHFSFILPTFSNSGARYRCYLKNDNVASRTVSNVMGGHCPEPPPVCKLTADTDYRGQDLQLIKNVASADECGKLCLAHSTCSFFTYVLPNYRSYSSRKRCYLKKSGVGKRRVVNAVGGDCGSKLAKACTIVEDTRFRGKTIQKFSNIPSADECSSLCVSELNCNHFTYFPSGFSVEKVREMCILKGKAVKMAKSQSAFAGSCTP